MLCDKIIFKLESEGIIQAWTGSDGVKMEREEGSRRG